MVGEYLYATNSQAGANRTIVFALNCDHKHQALQVKQNKDQPTSAIVKSNTPGMDQGSPLELHPSGLKNTVNPTSLH